MPFRRLLVGMADLTKERFTERPSCVRVVIFLAVNSINYKLQLRLLHIATTNS